jgi:MerR family transcriptional regulator, thiopeptide resistance regulator
LGASEAVLIEMRRSLRDRLEALAARLSAAEDISVDEFIEGMEMMNTFEKYYTPEQLAEIKARGDKLGAEAIRQAEAEWPELIAKVRIEMEKGTDPTSPSVQALAKRWMELVNAFTGGNPEIAGSLRKMYQQEPDLRQQTGMDFEIMEYVRKATEAAT